MVFRAALISNSDQSFVSNYVHNREILDKSVYEFLNTLPYSKSDTNKLKPDNIHNTENHLMKIKTNIKCAADNISFSKSFKSISSYEMYSNVEEPNRIKFNISKNAKSMQTINGFSLNASKIFKKKFLSKSLADLLF
jgi:hypothetical protein